MNKIAVNNKLQVSGDFSGYLLVGKNPATKNIDVKAQNFTLIGHNDPATFMDRLRTVKRVWDWTK